MTGLGRSLLAFAVAVMAFGGTARAGETAPRLELHRVKDEWMVAFATKFFYKRYPKEVNWSLGARRPAQENWARTVREQTYFAEAALEGSDGHELILVVDSPNWCDELGCLGAIFRRIQGGSDGYEFICSAPFPGASQPGAEILPETENGFHLIRTPTRMIQWYPSQKFDSGNLCAVETPE